MSNRFNEDDWLDPFASLEDMAAFPQNATELNPHNETPGDLKDFVIVQSAETPIGREQTDATQPAMVVEDTDPVLKASFSDFDDTIEPLNEDEQRDLNDLTGIHDELLDLGGISKAEVLSIEDRWGPIISQNVPMGIFSRTHTVNGLSVALESLSTKIKSMVTGIIDRILGFIEQLCSMFFGRDRKGISKLYDRIEHHLTTFNRQSEAISRVETHGLSPNDLYETNQHSWAEYHAEVYADAFNLHFEGLMTTGHRDILQGGAISELCSILMHYMEGIINSIISQLDRLDYKALDQIHFDTGRINGILAEFAKGQDVEEVCQSRKAVYETSTSWKMRDPRQCMNNIVNHPLPRHLTKRQHEVGVSLGKISTRLRAFNTLLNKLSSDQSYTALVEYLESVQQAQRAATLMSRLFSRLTLFYIDIDDGFIVAEKAAELVVNDAVIKGQSHRA